MKKAEMGTAMCVMEGDSGTVAVSTIPAGTILGESGEPILGESGEDIAGE